MIILQRPGSEIVLKDVFKSQSDIPKRCFAKVYKESGPQAVDYFSCETCRVKCEYYSAT